MFSPEAREELSPNFMRIDRSSFLQGESETQKAESALDMFLGGGKFQRSTIVEVREKEVRTVYICKELSEQEAIVMKQANHFLDLLQDILNQRQAGIEQQSAFIQHFSKRIKQMQSVTPSEELSVIRKNLDLCISTETLRDLTLVDKSTQTDSH
jgi:5-methylthioribose kinase